MRPEISLLFLPALLLTFLSCSDQDNNAQLPQYDGPVIETDSIQTLYSDSAIVRVELRAKLQQEFQNQDQHFPEGLKVTFFDKESAISSILTANQGYYYYEDGLYKVTGNVVLRSYERNETLETEELFWDPKKKEVYTDKFVRIENEDRILMGEGLTAAQDFSTSKILKPSGMLQLNDEADE